MAAWTFSDGTELTSGGKVSGSGAIADALREWIRTKRPVHALPRPSEPVALATSSDYLLDCLAVEVSHATHRAFETEYERDENDAPPALRASLAQARAGRDQEPFGRVY